MTVGAFILGIVVSALAGWLLVCRMLPVVGRPRMAYWHWPWLLVMVLLLITVVLFFCIKWYLGLFVMPAVIILANMFARSVFLTITSFRFLGRRLSTRRRNRELDGWAASVPVSDRQREAMSKLWDAAQVHTPPTDDPLQHLSSGDREYIRRICSADFRPSRFGDESDLRISTFLRLKEDGFTSEQAAVIVGMIFNGVGKVALDPGPIKGYRRLGK